jgi:alkylated DNA repair dioxygenase AlkB
MLFGPPVPDGFEYRPGFITSEEERELVSTIGALAFQAVEMRGVVARRRTVHYGWTYGYYARRSEPGPPLPEYLHPFRARVAAWAGLDPDRFVEALVTEYPPGAPIGWHRDAPQFGDVIAGISLLGASRMKFRRYVSPGAIPAGAPPRRSTHEIELARRSGYLITGEARRGYEHSIPPVATLRYSITFRTLR